MAKTYYPKRDRGVYRAASNLSNPLHEWGCKLVKELHKNTISGFLLWAYREKGYDSILRDLIYADNPFLKLLGKADPGGGYVPVPLKFSKD